MGIVREQNSKHQYMSKKSVLDVRSSYITNQFGLNYINVIPGKVNCYNSNRGSTYKKYFHCHRRRDT